MSDIFVALPPATKDNCVIFGKNSDRPPSEVQDIVYYAGSDNSSGEKLKCTFIEVEQAEKTYDIVISKPSWSWGAEIGANQHGVCVGCTSVWTKLCHSGDHEEKLIGVDFVRLALERSTTAHEGLKTITSHLEKYGQGGPNSIDPMFGQWSYNNSFMIVDNKEAWVLDTAGKFWAAKKYTSGVHNISSALSIETNYDDSYGNLPAEAEAGGFWKSDKGPLNFKEAFDAEFTGISLSEEQLPSYRLSRGRSLLEERSKDGKFSMTSMSEILRDDRGNIDFLGELLTVSSQISVLQPPSNSNVPHGHWFTGTPNTLVSIYKPFFFCPEVDIGSITSSSGGKKHALYEAHERRRSQMEESNCNCGQSLLTTMLELERQCVQDVEDFLSNPIEDLTEMKDLFKDVAESEVKFYKS